jgi:hypothetical protein
MVQANFRTTLEKCPIVGKEAGHWKWCRTFTAKKALNVRRDGSERSCFHEGNTARESLH